MATITYTIPNEKLDDFKAGILKLIPNNELKEDTGELRYTDNQWIKEIGKRWFIRQYKLGKIKIAEELNHPIIDEQIVE